MRAPLRKALLGCALSLGAVGLLAAASPSLLGSYHTGVGARQLEAALQPVFSHRLAPEQIVDGPALSSGIAHLQTALRYDATNVHAQRLLARAYVSTGDLEAARQALEQALEISSNPMLQLELADVHDMLGEPAIGLYQQGRIGSRALPLTANYLKLASAYEGTGSADLAIRAWQSALELDPGNLAALSKLEAQHVQLGDQGRAERYHDLLQAFDLSAVAIPQDFRLARAQAEAMVALVEHGLWDHELLLRVLSYQVWRFHDGLDGLMLDESLRTLTESRPDDPDVLFLRAELFHRRGELESAEAHYQQVVALDPANAGAALRLAALSMAAAQGAAPDCTEAQRRLERYRDLMPGDLLGLQLEPALYDACGEPVPPELQREASAVLDRGAIAARMVGLEAGAVRLGPELLTNGGFETWRAGSPSCWYASDMSNQEPFAAAAYWVGAEQLLAFEGTGHARISGLWAAPPEDGQSKSRAGFWVQEATDACPGSIALQPGAVYLFGALYRTSPSLQGTATLWLSNEGPAFWPGDMALPPTGGAWWHVVAIMPAGETATEIRPLVRMFGSGEVEFDAAGVYELELPASVAATLAETQVWVSKGGMGGAE